MTFGHRGRQIADSDNPLETNESIGRPIWIWEALLTKNPPRNVSISMVKTEVISRGIIKWYYSH